MATINMGQSPPSSAVNDDGHGLPFIQGNAEFGPRSPRPEKFCTKPKKQARSGDILLSVRAPVGALNMADRSLCIGRGLAAVTATGMDSEFLWHALHWSVHHLGRVSQGSTFTAVNKRDLHTLEIPLPAPNEQRKIAAILSSVDDAIEKTQAVIDQVEVIKRGLMQELFTRGLPGRHTEFKQSKMGEIPEAWEVYELSSLCFRMFVGIAQAATHAYTEQGVPIIRTTNIRENRIDVDNLLCITDEFAREMKRKTLCGGDVLTARTGYPGTSVVVPESLSGAQCFTLLVSRPGPRLRARFLCHIMNSDIGSQIVNRGQAGGAQQNLNVSVFKKARVALPPLEEQDAICDALDTCYALVDREKNWKGGLYATKTALMSALLTGEMRVTRDTEAA